METDQPKSAPPPPSQVRCILSGLALGGEFLVYFCWASSPPERTVGLKPLFWGAALVVGFFYTIQGFRLAQSWRGRFAASFLVFAHLLSLLFLFFMIAATGARP